MGYKQAHNRVRRVRGPAKEKFCSARRCDRAAAEWALNLQRADGRLRYENGRTYSDDPGDYDALCRACHRMNDGNPYA